MFKKSFVVLMSLLMMGFIAKAQINSGEETGQNLEYNVISTAVPHYEKKNSTYY